MDKQSNSVFIQAMIKAKDSAENGIMKVSVELWDVLTERLAVLEQPNEPLTCKGCTKLKKRMDIWECRICERNSNIRDYYESEKTGGEQS